MKLLFEAFYKIKNFLHFAEKIAESRTTQYALVITVILSVIGVKYQSHISYLNEERKNLTCFMKI